jgi:hypothetical protein
LVHHYTTTLLSAKAWVNRSLLVQLLPISNKDTSLKQLTLKPGRKTGFLFLCLDFFCITIKIYS